MKKIIHEIYKDYAEQPFISSERDLDLWSKNPELFHYGVIEKRQMVRLNEHVLPGHIIMLWRINFDNFTNESGIPLYFEYRYGVDSNECLNTLIDLKFIEVGSASESLDILNMTQLKPILIANGLDFKGKKNEVLERVLSNVNEDVLKDYFTVRKYKITPLGKDVLNKYPDIIKRHGTK